MAFASWWYKTVNRRSLGRTGEGSVFTSPVWVVEEILLEVGRAGVETDGCDLLANLVRLGQKAEAHPSVVCGCALGCRV